MGNNLEEKRGVDIFVIGYAMRIDYNNISKGTLRDNNWTPFDAMA
jgi:hypothetical protein